MKKIDSKFRILAINMVDGRVCDETNCLLVAAKGKAVPAIMQRYLAECERLGSNPEHVESVKCLIQRIEAFQAGTYKGAIDRKFRVFAVKEETREVYDEHTSFVLLATDLAAPEAIRAQLEECYRLSALPEHIEATQHLLRQVLEFQAENGAAVPVTVGKEAVYCTQKI